MEVADINKPLTFRNRIHPWLFALWISFASIIMMFGALMSAYIVKSAAGNWLEFGLPSQFYISTGLILSSSVCIHLAYKSFVGKRESSFKAFLFAALALGISFIVFQYLGYQNMFAAGVDLKANVSGSFVYLITGLHVLHVMGGITAITVALINAFLLPFITTEKRKIRLKLVCHYWHFVDILWIYLFCFLLFYK